MHTARGFTCHRLCPPSRESMLFRTQGLEEDENLSESVFYSPFLSDSQAHDNEAGNQPNC